jgi:hypothetical protein
LPQFLLIASNFSGLAADMNKEILGENRAGSASLVQPTMK